MKQIAYLFLCIITVSVILAPATELLCLFGDICKINSALVSSSRAAVLMASEEDYVQDAEAAIDEEKFEKLFKESFCKGLGLTEDISNENRLNSKSAGILNDFSVEFQQEAQTDSLGSPIRDAYGNPVIVGCSIEVKTDYKFKTELMRKYVENFNTPQTKIRLKRHQTLKLDF